MIHKSTIVMTALFAGLLVVTGGCRLMQQESSYQLPEGIEVSSLDGIKEGYSERKTDEGYYHFTVNVSAEHIADFFLALAEVVSEPAFFLVELGVNKQEELELRKSDTDPFHKHVYYLDGIDFKRAEALFMTYKRILVHDGMVNFGFGSHHGHDEVFVGSYKIFEIFTDSPIKYRHVLEDLGLSATPDMRTVWQTFTEKSPGRCNALDEKPNVWDMLEEMKTMGFYQAETRED